MILLLLACATKSPEPLFAPLKPQEVPEIPQAVLKAEANPDPEECSKAYTVHPGEPFDQDCRGHVLPTSDFVEYLRMQAELPFYKTEATKQYELRQADRNLSNTVHMADVEEKDALRKENRGLRLSTLAAAGLGLIVGAGATAGAVALSRTSVEVQVTTPDQ